MPVSFWGPSPIFSRIQAGVTYSHISQHSVTTRLWCDDMFNGDIIVNLQHLVTSKEFWKSVGVRRRCTQGYIYTF